MSEAPTIVDSIYIGLGEDAEFAYWEGFEYRFVKSSTNGQYYEYRLYNNGFFESSQYNILYSWGTRKWQDSELGDPIGIFGEYNPEYVTLTRSAGGLLGVFGNPYYVNSTRQSTSVPETNITQTASSFNMYIDSQPINGTYGNTTWDTNNELIINTLSSNNIYFGTVPGNYIDPGSNFLIGNFTALNRGDDYDTWDNTYLDFYNHGPPNQMLSVGGDAVIDGNLGIVGLTVRGGDFAAGLGAMWVEGPESGQIFNIQAYKNESTDHTAGVNASTLNADVSLLCLNPKGGNVGIGTYTPDYKLKIEQGFGVNNGIFISNSDYQINNVGTSLNRGVHIRMENSYAAIDGHAGAGYTTDLFLQSGGGKVGIGTLTPSSKGKKLYVGGGIECTNGAFFDKTGVIEIEGLDWDKNSFIGYGTHRSWVIQSGTSSGFVTMQHEGGNVGIGTFTPSRGKLHIVGSVTTTNLGSYAYYNSSVDPSARLGIGTAPNPYSLYCDSYVAAAEFNAFSDIRIKKNIVDINDSSALDKIRLLEPKIYNYIDELERGTSNVYGFIAQEVANVLPYAVTISEGDIPNILRNAYVSVIDNNTVELTLESSVEELSLSNTSVINIITDNDKVLKCNVLSFSETNVITIENTSDFSNVTNAFIKGEQVSDFHHLNKDAIWAVSTAALQEVDRQLQAEKVKVLTLETQIADLLARVTALES